MIDPKRTLSRLEVRSVLMLVLLAAPVVVLLYLLSPNATHPDRQQRQTQGANRGAEQSQPVAPTPNRIDKDVPPNAANNQNASTESDELNRRVADATERQADYAKAQTVMSAVGLFATLVLLVYTALGLDVAHSAAETALTQTRLLGGTFLELKDAKTSLFHSDEKGQNIIVRVEYTLYNPTDNVARLVFIRREWGIWDDSEEFPESVNENSIPVDFSTQKGFAYAFDFGPLTEAQQDLWRVKKLAVRINFTVAYEDLLGNNFGRRMQRLCLIGPGHIEPHLFSGDLPVAEGEYKPRDKQG